MTDGNRGTTPAETRFEVKGGTILHGDLDSILDAALVLISHTLCSNEKK